MRTRAALRPLLLVDARRGSSVALARTLAASGDRFECWVWSYERPAGHRSLTKWISAENPSRELIEKIVRRNQKSAVLFARSGETDWPPTPEPHTLLFRKTKAAPSPTWHGWAFAPRSHFETWSQRRLSSFLEGSLEPDRSNSPLLLSPSALRKIRVLLVVSKDLDLLRTREKDRILSSIERLRERHLIFLMAPGRFGFIVRVFSEGKTGRTLVPIEPDPKGVYDEMEMKSVLSDFFDRCDFDLVRFEQLEGVPHALVETARSRVKTEIAICEPPPLDVSITGLPKKVPSSFAKRTLIEKFGFSAKEIVVEPGETDLETLKRSDARIPTLHQIAFVGEFSARNGSRDFAKLVGAFENGPARPRFTVFGEIVDSALALQMEESFGVEFFGPCPRPRMKSLLLSEKIDAALILADESEFSAQTVLDAASSGVWPIVRSESAAAECVESLGWGSVLRSQSLVSDFRNVLRKRASIPVEPCVRLSKNSNLNV